MNEIWITNASPVIALAKIERLDLLLDEGHTLLVPKAVADEILQSHAQDPARRALETGWGAVPVAAIHDPQILEWGLGAGETEVLSLARQRKATAIVDDRAARTACKALDIRVIGTLSVVLRARIQGRIDSAVEILKALQGVGLYLDENLIRIALQKTTGETWPG
jgi:predicted nucleic acid-binding protein